MKLPLSLIGGELPLSDDERDRNVAHVTTLDAALDAKRAVVRDGWGAHRAHRKGKLTAWERIALLADDGTPLRPVGTLVNWGRDFAGARGKQAST